MSDNKGAIGAIIVGAGTGNRMGLGYNKVLADLCGRPVIEWTVRNFIQSGLIDNLVLVINPNDQKEMKDIFSSFKDLIDLKIAYGGETRQDSVYNGIKALSDDVK